MQGRIDSQIADMGPVSSIFKGSEKGGGFKKCTLKLGAWKKGGGFLCLKIFAENADKGNTVQ